MNREEAAGAKTGVEQTYQPRKGPTGIGRQSQTETGETPQKPQTQEQQAKMERRKEEMSCFTKREQSKEKSGAECPKATTPRTAQAEFRGGRRRRHDPKPEKRPGEKQYPKKDRVDPHGLIPEDRRRRRSSENTRNLRKAIS